jgi:hypothetical protein
MQKINVFLLLQGLAKADLPVHCISKEDPSTDKLLGTWFFHVSKSVDTVNLFQTKEVCTHNLPNRVQVIQKENKFHFDSEDIWKVKLLPKKKI